MTNKKNAPSDQQESNKELLDSLALLGISQLLQELNGITRTILIEILLLITVKKIAEQNDLTLREQLHIWRPFDV